MAYGNQVKTDSLSTTYSSEVYPVGSVYVEPASDVTAADASLGGDRVWLFIKASAAIAVNDLCEGAAADRNLAAPSAAAANANPNALVGVANHAIAINEYGWIIARGECVVKSAGVAAGNVLATVGTVGTVGPHGTGSVVAGVAGFGRAKTATGTPSAGLSDVYISLL